MAFIEERLRKIENKYAYLIRDMVVLLLTEEMFRLVLFLNDGTNLRITERWQGETLIRYSYYWLDADDRLKGGWDNSPHHERLENFPHHKHIGGQAIRVPSYDVCLEDVMTVLQKRDG